MEALQQQLLEQLQQQAQAQAQAQQQQNMQFLPQRQMTSQFRGVTYSKKSAKWQVRNCIASMRRDSLRLDGTE